MKKFIWVLLLNPAILLAQLDLSAGMGINVSSKSSLKDYINVSFAYPGNEIQSFETEAEFFGEADYQVNEKYDVGLEYAVSIFSYNNSLGLGVYEFSLVHHKPSLLGYYVIKGQGYKFKFGGGVGPRIAISTEKLPNTTLGTDYSAVGWGMVLKTYGMTALGDHLFAYIGGDLRLDMPGVPEGNGIKLHDNSINEDVNLNSISAGLKLGIVYSL